MALQESGVRLVVKDIANFTRNMKKADSLVNNFAEQVFDIGSAVGNAGLEKLGLGILDVGDAFAVANPYVQAAIIVTKEYYREVQSAIQALKKIASTIISFVVTAFKLLKNVISKVVSVALAPFKKALDFVTGSLRRVFEIASGILIAGTIRRIGDAIKTAGQQALEAAINFQVLQTRLLGLAARQMLNEDETLSFSDALSRAAGKSEELLDWVVQLSKTAPLSTDAIANTLTMATSYGLAENAAKDMTTAVLTFASGMGLTDLAQRRIIENFGQMIQQGKITSMELRDMGRGAFVPVNDLLNRTAELLGMTADQFDGTAGSINKFANKAGLDPTMAIMEAFIQLTEEEFPGAIERMGATIQGLRQRFSNLVNSLVGLNMLKPALDLLGQTFGNLLDKIGGSERIDILSQMIGDRLTGLVNSMLDNLPPMEDIVTNIANFLGTIWSVLGDIQRGDFFGALETMGVPQSLLDFITTIKNFKEGDFATFLENVRTKFNNLLTWWNENKEPIITALRLAIGDIAGALGIELESLKPTSPLENFLQFKDPEGTGGGLLDSLTGEDVAQKIRDVADALVDVITFIQGIPAAVTTALPYIAALGAGFFILKHPLLSFIGLLIGLPGIIGTIMFLALKTIIAKGPEWFKTGSYLMHRIQEGFADVWNNKIVGWLSRVITTLLDKLGPIGDVLRSKGITGSLDSLKVTVPEYTAPMNSTTNNTQYNFNVNANYSQVQSPTGISTDLSLLAGKMGP